MTAKHAYDGIEHTQPGPFEDCLLCRIERLERVKEAATAYVRHAYPSLLHGKTDPSMPLLSALGTAITADDGGGA